MDREDLIQAAQLAENVRILAARLRPHDALVGVLWHDYRQMPVLKLPAVVALSVGLNPYFADLEFAATALTDPFMSDEVKAHCEQFMRRLAITKANLDPYGTLPVTEPASGGWESMVRLADFAQLADRLGWVLPEEFPRGVGLPNPRLEKSLSTRERDTLLTIIAALCDFSVIKHQERGMASKIAIMTQEIGVPVSDDTIRNVLAKIPGALEDRR